MSDDDRSESIEALKAQNELILEELADQRSKIDTLDKQLHAFAAEHCKERPLPTKYFGEEGG